MDILSKWLNDLGYNKNQLKLCSFNCNNSVALKVSINMVQFQDIERRKIYNQGLVECRAKSILKGIFEKECIPAIEVFLKYDTNNQLYYDLGNGYHRYRISKFLEFSYIHIIIREPKKN